MVVEDAVLSGLSGRGVGRRMIHSLLWGGRFMRCLELLRGLFLEREFLEQRPEVCWV